ncbi:MAG: DUF350 domain-containing protein [Nitrospinales bacterium]
MSTLGNDLLQGLAFLALCIILFWVSKAVKDIFTPYSINAELRKSNIAVAVSLTGYLFATIIVLLGALLGPSKHFFHDIYSFVGYSLLGIVLLNVSRVINDKIILSKFCNIEELIRDQNVGTAAVEFGSYIAAGLVVAGSIHGTGGGIHTALAFFVMGQITLVLFARLYNVITPFDIQKEIESDNVAVGVAFGGTLVALGIILFGGSVGNFISWQYNITNFVISVATSFIFLPIVRFIVDKVLLPKTNLNKAISEDRNIAIGLLEMSVVISFAVILFFSIDFNLNFK